MMAEPRRARIALVRGLDILVGHSAGAGARSSGAEVVGHPVEQFRIRVQPGGDGFHIVVGAEWTTAAPKEIATEGRPSR